MMAASLACTVAIIQSSERRLLAGGSMATTIFERYGGFAKVSRVVMVFYDKVLESDMIGGYFEDVDLPRLIDPQTKFIASVMGGPASFSDDHLQRAHAGLGIDDAAFSEMLSLLEQTFSEFGFDKPDIDSVIAQVRTRAPFIITR
jgi:hemoglobin